MARPECPPPGCHSQLPRTWRETVRGQGHWVSNATTDGVPRKMLTAGPGFCVTLSTSLTLCCELRIFMSLPHANGEGIGDAIGKFPRTGYKYEFNKQSIVNVILKKLIGSMGLQHLRVKMGAPASVCAGAIRINGKGSARWLSREGRLSHPVTHRVKGQN